MAGAPHAEVAALADLTPEETAGAQLYITLEPCCHWGKTPPCTDLIIRHKISHVIYGFRDPHPAVAGKGQQILLDAGINCSHQPLPEIDAFYASYDYWLKTGRPWVTAKLALSLDGCIAGEKGEPMTLTGSAAQQFTHRQRLQSDAILTTARTICRDNPQLNIRLENQVTTKPIYVLDRHKEVLPSARIFKTGAPVILLQEDITLREILDKIGKDGIHDLWVEAGGTCFSAFIEAKLVQRAFIYVAPIWLGEQAQRAFKRADDLFVNANSRVWQVLGEDVVCEMRW
jgi:diaminohydroxyphosphoribosylaminopyrimidine deaminase / 5-amino-6-(5-phosphoribosylamino)uracil reductase